MFDFVLDLSWQDTGATQDPTERRNRPDLDHEYASLLGGHESNRSSVSTAVSSLCYSHPNKDRQAVTATTHTHTHTHTQASGIDSHPCSVGMSWPISSRMFIIIRELLCVKSACLSQFPTSQPEMTLSSSLARAWCRWLRASYWV